MLNRSAFANSIAVTVGIFYIAFYVLLLAVPTAFKFLFNAQFFGADVNALLRGGTITFGTFVGVLVASVVLSWIMGYVWAHFYNQFKR